MASDGRQYREESPAGPAALRLGAGGGCYPRLDGGGMGTLAPFRILPPLQPMARGASRDRGNEGTHHDRRNHWA